MQLHFTPIHASWFNQIELWFATLTRCVLVLGNFAGLDELAEKVRCFIEYYNNNEAEPYRWTYTGQPRIAAAMVEAAAENGADIIKFSHIYPRNWALTS